MKDACVLLCELCLYECVCVCTRGGVITTGGEGGRGLDFISDL